MISCRLSRSRRPCDRLAPFSSSGRCSLDRRRDLCRSHGGGGPSPGWGGRSPLVALLVRMRTSSLMFFSSRRSLLLALLFATPSRPPCGRRSCRRRASFDPPAAPERASRTSPPSRRRWARSSFSRGRWVSPFASRPTQMSPPSPWRRCARSAPRSSPCGRLRAVRDVARDLLGSELCVAASILELLMWIGWVVVLPHQFSRSGWRPRICSRAPA